MMELSWLHAVLALAVVVALVMFGRAFFGGSRMLGSFWDRERARRAAAVDAARAQREK
jgi:hypothetical protein